jgi:hypothetical protein
MNDEESEEERRKREEEERKKKEQLGRKLAMRQDAADKYATAPPPVASGGDYS